MKFPTHKALAGPRLLAHNIRHSMNTSSLHQLLSAASPPRLLHVLPEEVFAAARLPGSVHACIYEVSFPEKVAAVLPDKAAPVVVYGSDALSLEAAEAAEALRAAGYVDVSVYEDGLAGWRAAGQPLEGHGTLPGAPQPADGTYAVDIAESIVRWTGRNLFNHHSGTVRLAGGQLRLLEGRLVSASFDVAVDTIACEDIADGSVNCMLIDHLKSADFFEVAKHPVASFVASAAEPIEGATEGRPNFQLAGTLTVRGVSRPVEFPAVVAVNPEGRLTGQACLDLDRTEFGSIYGSGRLFRFLGQHVVNDVIHLHLKIHAARAASQQPA